MKSRDIFLPSLSSVLIAGMVAFLSCAHQSRNAEDIDVPTEDSYAESDMGAKEDNQDSSSLGETSEESSNKDILAKADTSKNSQEIDSLEKELESGNSTPSNELANEPTNEPVKEALNDSSSLEGKNAKEPSFEDELEGKTGTTDSMGAEVATAGASTAGADLGANTAGGSDLVEPKKEELLAKDTISPTIEPFSTETLNLDKKVSKPRLSRAGFRVPKIPAKAITKNGVKLNRFYFVRRGDTPKKVSQLIYETPKKADKLVKWNGKAWTPGKVIYYSSAEKPKDSKMDSFYKEKGISFEEYTVSKGDWLSKIALKKLGSPKSWVEIAVVNDIKSPKSLEVGQKIAIYPMDLTAKPQETMIAKNEPLEQPVKQPAPVEPPPAAVQPPAPQPAEAEAPPVAASPKPEVKSAPVGFDSQKFFEQNMFAIGLFLVAFFLILLMIVKRRNKNRLAVNSEEFGDGEEGFQPPTKLKRK
jgi:hypothetical protein